MYVNCPACLSRAGSTDTRRRCRISLTTGWWRCYRPACGARGRLDGDWAEDVEVEDWGDHSWDPPSDFSLLTEGARVLQPGRDYLEERGVPQECWERAGVGYALEGAERGHIIVPAIGHDGEPIGWVARAVRGKGLRTAPGMDRWRRLLNEPALIRGPGHAVALVEGPIDCLAQWWRPPNGATAFLGKPTPKQLQRVAALCGRSGTVPVVALDGDTVVPQRNEALATARWLRSKLPRVGLVLGAPKADPASASAQYAEAIRIAAEGRTVEIGEG